MFKYLVMWIPSDGASDSSQLISRGKRKNVLPAFRDENISDLCSKGHRICQGFNEIEFHHQLVKHVDEQPQISICVRTSLTFFQSSTTRALKEKRGHSENFVPGLHFSKGSLRLYTVKSYIGKQSPQNIILYF